ncbi:MAG TPA: hypothetical protein VKM94_06570 [Blastocatellia bacterium]|nr:hypothetical protein [Blastocatellia bacterium]
MNGKEMDWHHWLPPSPRSGRQNVAPGGPRTGGKITNKERSPRSGRQNAIPRRVLEPGAVIELIGPEESRTSHLLDAMDAEPPVRGLTGG